MQSQRLERNPKFCLKGFGAALFTAAGIACDERPTRELVPVPEKFVPRLRVERELRERVEAEKDSGVGA